MPIIFIPETHEYKCIDPNDYLPWTSVTTALSAFKQPFDSVAISEKVSNKKSSKWYGMSPERIREVWKAEADRACNLGNFYHDKCERELLSNQTMERYGKHLPVIWPVYDELGRKMASSQRLHDGIYPEHMVYLRSARIIGQSDLVEVADGKIHVGDYKTNKKIEKTSFVNYEGISKKMLHALSHLDDCNYNHYNLQLSIYMYMMLKHNPRLKPGTITIHHVSFEQEGEDEFGYPITRNDENGDPIIQDVELYDMPYLEREAYDVIEYIKHNPVTKKSQPIELMAL